MSGQRAAAEPYTTRFETAVSAVDGRSVWLETTFFYAESDGHPADRGTIGSVELEDVQLVDGEHVHVLTEEPSFRAGHRVMCSIDWAYRMYCMRAHTATHVLYGGARRVLEDPTSVGFEIGAETVRVTLETDTQVDDEALIEIDRLVNQAIWESRPVSWETIPIAEARERDEISIDKKTDSNAIGEGRVRIVTIGAEDDNDAIGSDDPWDVGACSGTHVRNTREIGPMTVLGRSTSASGQTCIEFTVGERAIQRRECEKRATFAASKQLGVPVEEIPTALGERFDDS